MERIYTEGIITTMYLFCDLQTFDLDIFQINVKVMSSIIAEVH